MTKLIRRATWLAFLCLMWLAVRAILFVLQVAELQYEADALGTAESGLQCEIEKVIGTAFRAWRARYLQDDGAAWGFLSGASRI